MSTGFAPTIAVLGGGQLGRMLALAGYPLGLRFRFLDPNPDSPAGHVGELLVGEFDDPEALLAVSRDATLLTYEFENVPVASARLLEGRLPVYPPPGALEVSQDRLSEKRLFRGLGIPTPEFASVDTRADLDAAVARIGLPSVLKTRRFGYDGKGQAVLRTPADVGAAWGSLGGSRPDGRSAVPLILEAFVPFDREVSVLAVRSATGQTAFYPLVQNVHRGGILRESLAPAPPSVLAAPGEPPVEEAARMAAARILEETGYVGVLAVEFFEVGGVLLANEMAPRVHNSGHWTIEGAQTSQFENHLRAVLGLPLGPTDAVGASLMFNLIGNHPPVPALASLRGVHLHLYGKAPRAGRKIGHVTVRAESGNPAQLGALADAVRALISAAG